MTGFGIFSFLAAGLQLIVPSYALRLVRRFGAQRVGWFVVLAFCALALLYLLRPLKPAGAGAGSGATLDLICIFASALLVIGMGHIETLCSHHQQAESETQRRRCQWQAEAREQAADLAKENQELVAEIARREQRERALRESERQYRFLFEENALPMWIFDLRSCQILAVNQAALHIYGFTHEEFTALTARELMPADTAPPFLLDAAKPCSGAQARGVWRHRKKDLALFDVEITAVDMKFGGRPARLVLANDVTQHRRREREASEAQKMAALARVAGGVAHHFNNLLAIINGHATLMLSKPQETPATEQLGQISAASIRAASLTRQLLAASGQQDLRQELMDVNGLFRKLSQVLRRLVGEHIHIRSIFGSQLPPILADPRVVEEAILSLVLNARDAMPRGGTLTFSTAWEQIDSAQAQRRSGAKPGEFIRIAVRDTGCGIPPEVQARLFEPFFTTRDIGQGTGLGLAGAYGVVRQHGGWIEFTTEPRLGTEFRLFFPRAANQASQALTPAFKETILLVEPDDRARAVARYFLSRHGYQVIEADSAATTLAIWEGHASKVDLLLTDFGLSGNPSGPDLAERLRKAKPHLKVAYTSEFSTDTETPEPAPPEGLEVVVKPFSPDRLIDAVQGCLARPG